MRYSVVLVPAGGGWIAATVPTMPGCVSQGRSRDEALAHVREAMEGWIEAEQDQGRAPLVETPQLVLDGVAAAIDIIDEMRAAGELPQEGGYTLEVATIELRQPVPA